MQGLFVAGPRSEEDLAPQVVCEADLLQTYTSCGKIATVKLVNAINETIEQAVLAERERCARIAEEYNRYLDRSEGACKAAIAAAIRSGE